MSDKITYTPEYRQFISDLKARVLSTRISAARAVNRDVILLYWDIGQGIVEKQRKHNWGDGVVEAVSRDLRSTFPGNTGFSPRNIWDMRRFFQAYNDPKILRQAVAESKPSLLPNKQKLPAELKGKLPSAKQLSKAVRDALPVRSNT